MIGLTSIREITPGKTIAQSRLGECVVTIRGINDWRALRKNKPGHFRWDDRIFVGRECLVIWHTGRVQCDYSHTKRVRLYKTYFNFSVTSGLADKLMPNRQRIMRFFEHKSRSFLQPAQKGWVPWHQ